MNGNSTVGLILFAGLHELADDATCLAGLRSRCLDMEVIVVVFLAEPYKTARLNGCSRVLASSCLPGFASRSFCVS